MTPDSEIDALVVGAGVVGLAAAAEIAAAGCSVAIAERHARAGVETSTHNSGVIHAGVYYPTKSLKALLCVEGAARLYSFCAARGVPADRCGKLVIARAAPDIDELEALRERGSANGVAGLQIVEPAFVRAREPHVLAAAALWSPESGRVDASALVRALLADAARHAAVFLPHAAVLGGEAREHAIDVRLEREIIRARCVVNAAGLFADDVSRGLGGTAFTIHPCRGEYAEVKPARRSLVNGLVYPLPHPSGHGLGVHLSRRTDGSLLLGPTIRYQHSKDDYEGDRLPLSVFVEAARMLVPDIGPEDVTYGGSGIRAKLHPPTERFADFLIGPDPLQPRLIHAAGIDSPGLTSCLAIARLVARHVGAVLS